MKVNCVVVGQINRIRGQSWGLCCQFITKIRFSSFSKLQSESAGKIN